MKRKKVIKIRNGKVNLFDDIDGRLIDSRTPTSLLDFVKVALDWNTKYDVLKRKKKND